MASSLLEVVKAWIDPSNKHPRTIHHQGKGKFAVDGETIKLPSKMKSSQSSCPVRLYEGVVPAKDELSS
jgi:hypothetical protein